jgi:crossover junction endodeoxyribonuclease RuvC
MLAGMSAAIRILGIDPGLNATGWGVIAQDGTRLSLIAHGVIKAPAKEVIARRLCFIHDAVEALLEEHRPHEAAIEDQFVAANPGSALKLGQARAAAMLAPARAGLPVGEYAPRLIKKAVVGTGGADKAQVAAMVSVLLPGAKAVADDADALAIAICHANHRNTKRLAS